MSLPHTIGILSDTHSALHRLERLAEIFSSRGTHRLIHCGDITSPEAVIGLKDFDVEWVFGNCDWNRAVLENAMRECGHSCHGFRGEIEIEGRRILFTHGDRLDLFDELLEDDHADLVIHGHTHEKRDVEIRGRRVLCPGALIRTPQPSAIILELPSLTAHFVAVGL